MDLLYMVALLGVVIASFISDVLADNDNDNDEGR